MTNDQFIYWLSGFLDKKSILDQNQTKLLDDQLNTVFNKIMPNLESTHQGTIKAFEDIINNLPPDCSILNIEKPLTEKAILEGKTPNHLVGIGQTPSYLVGKNELDGTKLSFEEMMTGGQLKCNNNIMVPITC